MLLPRAVNCVAVSTTISPVTHIALVDVKSASTKEIGVTVAFGSSKKAAPVRIKNPKLNIKSCAGFKTNVKLLMSNLENSKINKPNIKRE
jgi:hypothetical protein